MPFNRAATQFLLKLTLMLLLVGASGLAYFAMFADGRTDAYYLRFTSERQSSLVLGTSRGARGIRPEVFNESGLVFDGPLYNYAFTASWSPYGPTYLDAVRRKLDPRTTNGLFLLEVSPLGLTAPLNMTTVENADDSPTGFRETELPLGILRSMSRPVVFEPLNAEYLLRAYTGSYYRIALEQRFQRERLLHADGWLEFDYRFSDATVQRLTQSTVARYEAYFAGQHFSPQRLRSLDETVAFLAGHGTVVLVRLPVAPEMLALETDFLPEFDAQMQMLADAHAVPYLNFTLAPADRYPTQDGHHLSLPASQALSQDILAALP